MNSTRRVYRKKKDAYNPPTVKHGVGKIMLWGGFLQRGQNDFPILRRGWMRPCIARFWAMTSFPHQEHWRWIMAGYSIMTMTRNTQPGQRRWLHFNFLESPNQSPDLKSVERSLGGAETPCCPATAKKPERSGEELYGGVGQDPCCCVCKPDQELQETSTKLQVLHRTTKCVKYIVHMTKCKLGAVVAQAEGSWFEPQLQKKVGKVCW